MRLKEYPGHEMDRKELHRRLFESCQLAARLLLTPDLDPPEIRSEMEIVLLDFLADPFRADVQRLRLAGRGFHPFVARPVEMSPASSLSGNEATAKVVATRLDTGTS